MRAQWLMIVGTAALMMSSHACAGAQGATPFGKLRIFEPTGPVRGFVVLYSDAGGWDRNAESAASALGRKGALVAGVDLAEYRRRIDLGARHCAALVGDAEAASRDLQRARNYSRYRSPILAGIGEGGALAEAILRSAPPATLSGAVSLYPRVPKRPLCAAPQPHGGNQALPGFWAVGFASPSNELADRIKLAGAAVDVERVPA